VAIPSRVLGSGINSLSTTTSQRLPWALGSNYHQTEMGETIIVKNTGANPLTVYPYDTGSSINNVGFGTINVDCSAMFFAVSNSAMGRTARV
jgi:hypothetical protein